MLKGVPLFNLPATDAQTAKAGAIFDTEDGQVTLTNGRGDKIWFIDTTGGNVTVNLPAAADGVSYLYIVKRKTAGANTLTVQAASGNIDNAASHTIGTQYASYTYISDGDNYWII